MSIILLFAPFMIGFCIGTTLSKAATCFQDKQPIMGTIYLLVGTFCVALLLTHKATFTPIF